MGHREQASLMGHGLMFMAFVAGTILYGRCAEAFEIRGPASPDSFIVDRRTGDLGIAPYHPGGHRHRPEATVVLVPSLISDSVMTIPLNGCARL